MNMCSHQFSQVCTVCTSAYWGHQWSKCWLGTEFDCRFRLRFSQLIQLNQSNCDRSDFANTGSNTLVITRWGGLSHHLHFQLFVLISQRRQNAGSCLKLNLKWPLIHFNGSYVALDFQLETYFFRILWKSRCNILVSFPSHLKKLRSILRF